MSFSEAHLYLICYDITDPRRLQRVHAFLRRHAMPVQYSVFLARLTERRLLSLLADLARRIDPRSDDVRAYPIPRDADAVTMGRQYLPPGVVLADPLIGAVLEPTAGDEQENEPPECDKPDDRSEK